MSKKYPKYQMSPRPRPALPTPESLGVQFAPEPKPHKITKPEQAQRDAMTPHIVEQFWKAVDAKDVRPQPSFDTCLVLVEVDGLVFRSAR